MIPALLSVLQFCGILLLVLTVFNLLIVVHEWGHFLAARWRGLQVDRFQIWFGKPIWKFTWRGVQYGLGSIPLGGFVSLPQMAPMEPIEGKSLGNTGRASLPPVSPHDKIIVAFAGPLFSFLLAVVCALLVWALGKPVPDQATARVVGYLVPGGPAAAAGILPGDEILAVDGHEVKRIHGMMDSVDWQVIASEKADLQFDIRRQDTVISRNVTVPRDASRDRREAGSAQGSWATQTWNFVFRRPPLPDAGILGREVPRIGRVLPHSPAEEAGLLPGDLAIAVNGQPVRHRLEIAGLLDSEPAKPIRLTVQRGAREVQASVMPRLPEKRPGGFSSPMIGIEWDEFGQGSLAHIPPGVQLQESVLMMKHTLGAILNPATEVGAVHLSSAVGIMRLYYRLFQHPDGWRLVLWLSVVLNVNLALLNLLPIPVLDGGHIVLSALESFRGRPLPLTLLKPLQTAAALLLLTLMGVLVLKDVGDLVSDAQTAPGVTFLPGGGSPSGPLPHQR